MEKNKLKIVKYEMTFTKMTKKLFDEQEKVYRVAMISIRLDELQGRAGVMVKAGKPERNGTRITFRPAQNAEEYKNELDKIIEQGEKLGLKFEKIKK